MLLRLAVEPGDDHAVIIATGEIDVATADEVMAVITKALDEGQRQVLLDLAAVTFIDSTGLGMLIKAHRRARSTAATFAVVHPTAQTRKLIAVLGLDRLLSVYDTREQALSQRR